MKPGLSLKTFVARPFSMLIGTFRGHRGSGTASAWALYSVSLHGSKQNLFRRI
jgi:hypothetical protein